MSNHFVTALRGGLAALSIGVLLLGAPALIAAAPSNDSCAGAIVVPANGPFPSVTTTDSTTAGDDSGDPALICNSKFPAPAPAGGVSKTVWFTFTPGSTDNYQIDTLGSTPAFNYDTILGVYTGTCGSLAPLSNGCNDDTTGSFQSSVSVVLNAGTTYTILVGGLGSRDSFNQNTIIPSSGGQLKLNVKRVAVDYPYRYFIPSVAHAQGTTLYVSDVTVTNVDGGAGSFTMQFLNHGNSGEQQPPASQPALAPATIGAGATKEYPDVLALFGSVTDNPYGALVINSTRRLQVGAKTTTSPETGGGTFGQFALGLDAATDLLSLNESGRIIGVREDATTRTNVVLVNNSLFQCGAFVEVRNANGDVVVAGSKTVFLPPNTMVQLSGLKNYFGFSDDLRAGSITVKNISNSCGIGGVAYVIDRTTQDPFAVPLKK
ncbi:MAG: hypothetical protein ABIT01_17310 [Thermoanaerobaculia bacterium]